MVGAANCDAFLKTGGASVTLSRRDAALVRGAHAAATNPATWDNPRAFALEYQRRLTLITSALALGTIRSRIDYDSRGIRRRRAPRRSSCRS